MTWMRFSGRVACSESREGSDPSRLLALDKLPAAVEQIGIRGARLTLVADPLLDVRTHLVQRVRDIAREASIWSMHSARGVHSWRAAYTHTSPVAKDSGRTRPRWGCLMDAFGSISG
jgi:hypothetical protein